MADENVDFRFLGQQVKNLQTQMRDLRSAGLRLESDVVGIRADISRLDEQVAELTQLVESQHVDNQAQFAQVAQRIQQLDQKIDNHHQADQAQIKQMSDTNSTILQVIVTKLNDIEGRLPPRS